MVGHRGTHYCSCHYHHRGSSPSLGGESLSLSPSHPLPPSRSLFILSPFSLSLSLPLSLLSPLSLSQFGFFRRRKHEEIKQRREELQTLNDHGVTPAGASVDSIGNSNIEHISVGADKGGTDF